MDRTFSANVAGIFCLLFCGYMFGPAVIGYALSFFPRRRIKSDGRWCPHHPEIVVSNFVAKARELGLVTGYYCSGFYKDHIQHLKEAKRNPLNEERGPTPFVDFILHPGDSKNLKWLATFSLGSFHEYSEEGVSHGILFWPRDSHIQVRSDQIPNRLLDRIHTGYWTLARLVLPLVCKKEPIIDKT